MQRMSASPTERYRRNEDIVMREILGETLLGLDGSLTLVGICESMRDAFDVSEPQAWTDLCDLIGDFLDAGLIGKVE